MQIAKVQFIVWDKVYDFLIGDLDVKEKEWVLVNTKLGLELGQILSIIEKSEEELRLNSNNKEELKTIFRKANEDDINKVKNFDKQKVLQKCRELINKNDLNMKLIDVHSSYDASRLTFAFVSNGRVDFRELVRDLTSYFNKNIRLQQIGIRDEAKICGDYGHCGRQLCCKKFLGNNLSSITSDMAEVQQVAHRGSDRISGICGRLMCCLAYEELGYSELSKNLPPIGSKVDVDGEKGEVIGHNILKQIVKVKFSGVKKNDFIIKEVDINRNKSK